VSCILQKTQQRKLCKLPLLYYHFRTKQKNKQAKKPIFPTKLENKEQETRDKKQTISNFKISNVQNVCDL